jgi:hypothetical protein
MKVKLLFRLNTLLILSGPNLCKSGFHAFYFQFNSLYHRHDYCKQDYQGIQRTTLTQHATSDSRDIQMLEEIDSIEKQVIASAKAKVDVERILKILDRDYTYIRKNELAVPDDLPTTSSPFRVSLAAASIVSLMSYVGTSNSLVTVVVFVVVFIAALDPINSDNLAGTLARILGRSTLKSVADVQPKFIALARAVVTEEEEIILLTEKIRELENEVSELRSWKEKRETVVFRVQFAIF